MKHYNPNRADILARNPSYRPGRIRRWLKIAAVLSAVFVLIILKLRHDYPMPDVAPAQVNNVCLRSMT